MRPYTQVHEKSALLPLLPVTMLALKAPRLAAVLPPLVGPGRWQIALATS